MSIEETCLVTVALTVGLFVVLPGVLRFIKFISSGQYRDWYNDFWRNFD